MFLSAGQRLTRRHPPPPPFPPLRGRPAPGRDRPAPCPAPAPPPPPGRDRPAPFPAPAPPLRQRLSSARLGTVRSAMDWAALLVAAALLALAAAWEPSAEGKGVPGGGGSARLPRRPFGGGGAEPSR